MFGDALIIGRFPERYMFRLTNEEYQSLRSQNATLNKGKHIKYWPFAFTEYGILMLSSVLKSVRAEKVNILIIDTFVDLNEKLLTHKDLIIEMKEIREKVSGQDEKIEVIFNYLKAFILERKTPRTKVGFKRKED